MKRHLLSLLLLLMAVVMMVGCAPAATATDEPDVTDEPVEATDAPVEATDAPDATEAATEAPTEAASALPETITIGAAFGLSGDIAVYGESQRNGVELALQHINESAYLGEGVTLEVDMQDTTGTPEGAIAALETLVGNGVVAIIGPTLSSQAFAADPVAQEAGIPVLGVSNTAGGITDMGDFVFRNSLPESSVIPGTIAQSTSVLGLENVALLWGNDDDFTVSGADVFRAALEENGVGIAAEETFARGDVDFNAQLTNLIAAEPDALVVSALAQEAALIITQARAQGYTGPIIGGNGFNSPAIIANAGEDSEGVIVGAAWNIASTDEMSVGFAEAYQEAYGKPADQFAAQAYSGAWLVAEAIKQAQSVEPAAVRDALAAIADFATPLGSFSFDDNRDPVHEPVVQIVRDGAFVILTEETATSE